MNLDLLWKQDFDSGAVAGALAATVGILVLSWPGLLLFYGGLVADRRRTEAYRRMPVILAAASLAWGLWIYSLAFAPSWGSRPTSSAASPPGDFGMMMAGGGREDLALARGGRGPIGGTDFVTLEGLAPQSSDSEPHYPVRPRSPGLPHLAFMALHLALFVAATAPLLVLTAGRIGAATGAMLIVAWGTLVYAPLTHWVWGHGWLAARDALDFGGGLTHVGVGASALAFAFFRQDEHPGDDEGVSNGAVPSGAGALLVWGGGLASHAALAAGLPAGRAAIALVNSHFGACAGLFAWMGAARFLGWKNDPLAAAAGAVAGLAAVASGCGLMAPQSALAVGAAGGVVGLLAYKALRPRPSNAVPVAAFAVQAIPGMLGLLATGMFVTSSVAGVGPTGEAIGGLIEGDGSRLGVQTLAAASAAIYAFAVTFLCLGIVRLAQRRKGRRSPAGPDGVAGAASLTLGA